MAAPSSGCWSWVQGPSWVLATPCAGLIAWACQRQVAAGAGYSCHTGGRARNRRRHLRTLGSQPNHLARPLDRLPQGDDTIITWSDSDLGTDVALSFQEPQGCNYVWEQIQHIQQDEGAARRSGAHSPRASGGGEGSPFSPQMRRRGGGGGGGLGIDEYEGLGGGSPFEELGPHGGPVGAQLDPGSSGSIELPDPELGNLPSVAKALTEVGGRRGGVGRSAGREWRWWWRPWEVAAGPAVAVDVAAVSSHAAAPLVAVLLLREARSGRAGLGLAGRQAGGGSSADSVSAGCAGGQPSLLTVRCCLPP